MEAALFLDRNAPVIHAIRRLRRLHFVPMSSDIKLICFDLGGVLIRICRTWREAVQAARLDLRGDWVHAEPQHHRWQELGRQFGVGQIDGNAWSTHVSESIGRLYSPEEIRAIHDAWILCEYEGVGEVINRIHGAGLKTAALSNTNADHWPVINLRDRFPAVASLHHRFASHELRLAKPDPAIYRELERRMNYRGSEILFFDDLAENVQAAQSLGWSAVQIDPLVRTDSQIESALRAHGVL